MIRSPGMFSCPSGLRSRDMTRSSASGLPSLAPAPPDRTTAPASTVAASGRAAKVRSAQLLVTGNGLAGTAAARQPPSAYATHSAVPGWNWLQANQNA